TRRYLIDNTKCIMITLVVLGHFIEPLINSNNIIKSIFMSIYSVHMPIFVMLSGVFSRNEFKKENMIKLINSIFIPFFMFTLLYEAFYFLFTGSLSSYTVNFQPFWLLWFLFSLFIWKLLLPILLKSHYPVCFSLMISLIAGYIDSIGYFMGILRTIYFLPFFIVGYKWIGNLIECKKLRKIPKSVYFVILIFNMVFFLLITDFSHTWLYGSIPYAKLGSDGWRAVGIRLVLYSVSFISSFAILMVIPRKKSVLSKNGSNSIYVYLWHGFIVKICIWFGFLQWLKLKDPIVTMFVLFLISILLTLGLSTDKVRKKTQRILPKIKVTILRG
ncbi:acyltransferase family protein, partial [Aliivibrio salmonicida]